MRVSCQNLVHCSAGQVMLACPLRTLQQLQACTNADRTSKRAAAHEVAVQEVACDAFVGPQLVVTARQTCGQAQHFPERWARLAFGDVENDSKVLSCLLGCLVAP